MRWQRLPLLVLLIAVVPIAAATAAPARAGNVTESRVMSAVAADEGGVYAAAFAMVMEDNRGSTRDATLVALDPATGAERWRFAAGGSSLTSPVLLDGMLYVSVFGEPGDNTGSLSAVNAATGEERWRFGTGAPSSPPVAAGGVVYAAGGDHLYALDAASGTERWRRADVPPLASPLAVDRGTVHAAFFRDDCAAWHLATFDAATGAERSTWSIETAGNCTVGGPAVADGVAYIVERTGEGSDGGGSLVAVDAATGAERWRWGFDAGGPTAAPVVDAGTVYAVRTAGEGGVGDGELAALDAATGAERWRFGPGGFLSSPAVAADGTVYLPVPLIGQIVETVLYAIDDATGTERWRFPTGVEPTFSETFPAVAVAEGVAYVGGGETVFAADAASGAERWRSRLALALPASMPGGDSSSAPGTPADPASALGFKPLAAALLPADRLPDADRVAAAYNVRLQPGGRVDFPASSRPGGATLEHVVAGAYAVRSEGPLVVLRGGAAGPGGSAEEVPPGQEATVGPGDAVLVLEHDAPATVRNPGDRETLVFGAGVLAREPSSPPATPSWGVAGVDASVAVVGAQELERDGVPVSVLLARWVLARIIHE